MALHCTVIVLAEEKYDFSTPTSTFRSVGLAIKNDDPKAFYKIVASGHGRELTYEQFLDAAWKGPKSKYPPYLIYSPTVQASKQPASYFLQAEVASERTGEEDTPSMSDTVLVLRWKQPGIYRKEEFYRCAGEQVWHWRAANMYTRDYPIYEPSTPSNAYLALNTALQLGILSEVCNDYATSVRGGLSAKEWERVLNDRLSKFPRLQQEMAWEELMMASSEDELEVEMLPPEAGRDVVKANVWRMDRPLGVKTGGTRRSGETFVQEGKEWKWLPKPNCFWYPTKIETQQKAP